MTKYAPNGSQGSHARLSVRLAEGATMGDLLAHLGMPLSAKGITFVNGTLTDTPGLHADLKRELHDGDRIAFFHELSMWPFQYRFGAAVGAELKEAMLSREDKGLFHSSS